MDSWIRGSHGSDTGPCPIGHVSHRPRDSFAWPFDTWIRVPGYSSVSVARSTSLCHPWPPVVKHHQPGKQGPLLHPPHPSRHGQLAQCWLSHPVHEDTLMSNFDMAAFGLDSVASSPVFVFGPGPLPSSGFNPQFHPCLQCS
jgi:hypothetical protein